MSTKKLSEEQLGFPGSLIPGRKEVPWVSGSNILGTGKIYLTLKVKNPIVSLTTLCALIKIMTYTAQLVTHKSARFFCNQKKEGEK